MKRILFLALATMLAITGITLTAGAASATDHEWTYDVSCIAVSGNRPNTDSVDSNIRIKNLATNTVETFNYHGPDSAPAGPFSYSLASNYHVPASWTHFEIQWVQVNGTNYHWEGALECGTQPEEAKTDLCHATGSESNPFVLINVSVSGAYNGHLGDGHQNGEDIIPPFVYQGHTYSQNWDEDGQAIFNNGCVIPDETEEFTPYETDVCWTMDNSDGVVGTFEFPQTRGCQPPACEETVEYQHDTYWIRDLADEEYLAGLTHLNSPADDASLEPHDYYGEVVTGDDCAVQPPNDKQVRTVVGNPDCNDRTVTSKRQTRTRSYSWNGTEYVAGPWSKWKTVKTTTSHATVKQCPLDKVRGGVAKIDKCRTSGDYLKLVRADGGKYLVNGKVRHEGVWLKAGARVLNIKLIAAKNYKVVGKDTWRLVFTNAACPTPPSNPPHTGARTVA